MFLKAAVCILYPYRLNSLQPPCTPEPDTLQCTGRSVLQEGDRLIGYNCTIKAPLRGGK